MFDVITIGSATVDVFVKTAYKGTEFHEYHQHQDVCYPIGQKVLIEDLHIDTGGGGTNTAVAFSRLGLKTGWLGKLGTDTNSSQILEVIKKEKVAFLGNRGKGMTGYSVILVGLRENRTILTFKGINDQLSTSDVPWSRLKTKWLYCSAMLGQSFKTLEKICLFAKQHHIKYAFNPSMYLAAQGMQKLKKIIQDCDVLVLNKEEANALLGTQQKSMEFLLKKLQEHAKIAVVTDGPNGAHAYNGIKKYAIAPRRVRVVETTGAGDAFAAGFVAGLALHDDIAKAMQLGLAESESVIQHIGAKNKLLKRNEAKSLLKKMPAVKITKL